MVQQHMFNPRYKDRVFTWYNNTYSIPATKIVCLHGTTTHIQSPLQRSCIYMVQQHIFKTPLQGSCICMVLQHIFSPATKIVYLHGTTTHSIPAARIVYLRGTATHIGLRHKARVYTWYNNACSIPLQKSCIYMV